MKIVGLDLSLRATGIATEGGTQVIRVPLPTHATDQERALRLRTLSVLIGRHTRDAEAVVIEAPAFMAEFSHAHSLGELAGVVKVCLVQWRVPFILVTTQQMKKYATGKGNATKDQVLVAAHNEDPRIDDNNAADAFWLRRMGLGHYLNRDYVAPKYRKEVLESIRWPEVVEKEEAVGQRAV